MRRDVIGSRRHYITLENPSTPTPDGDGGFTQTWTACSPAQVFASIMPATARDQERAVAGTVMAMATHICLFPYHPDVNRKTRITFGTRTFAVAGVETPDERQVDTVVYAVERVV
jgi:head-tail adaptor